jgi:hypothetical protein
MTVRLAMRVCEACGREMRIQRRGARYCGDTCRKRGQRARQSPREPRTRDLSVTGYQTRVPVHIRSAVTDKCPSIAIRNSALPSGIVPDAKWPGMYRLVLADGSLSDMVNLTRAKEAERFGRDDGASAVRGKPASRR